MGDKYKGFLFLELFNYFEKWTKSIELAHFVFDKFNKQNYTLYAQPWFSGQHPQLTRQLVGGHDFKPQ